MITRNNNFGPKKVENQYYGGDQLKIVNSKIYPLYHNPSIANKEGKHKTVFFIQSTTNHGNDRPSKIHSYINQNGNNLLLNDVVSRVGFQSIVEYQKNGDFEEENQNGIIFKNYFSVESNILFDKLLIGKIVSDELIEKIEADNSTKISEYERKLTPETEWIEMGSKLISLRCDIN